MICWLVDDMAEKGRL